MKKETIDMKTFCSPPCSTLKIVMDKKERKKKKCRGKHPQSTNDYSKNKYSTKVVICFSLKWGKTVTENLKSVFKKIGF